MTYGTETFSHSSICHFLYKNSKNIVCYGMSCFLPFIIYMCGFVIVCILASIFRPLRS